MADRKRITPAQIKSLDDANVALGEIGKLMLQLEAIDGKADQEIGKIRDDAEKEGKDLRARIEELDSALAVFGEYNKTELFSDKKSLELAYGMIGFRQSSKISIKKTTLDKIKEIYPERAEAIRKKEEVNKEVLKDWSKTELSSVDASKKIDDIFFREVNREQINIDMLVG